MMARKRLNLLITEENLEYVHLVKAFIQEQTGEQLTDSRVIDLLVDTITSNVSLPMMLDHWLVAKDTTLRDGRRKSE